MPNGIPDPKPSLESLQKTLLAIKERVELMGGDRGDGTRRTLTIEDLLGAATFAELRDRLTGFSTPDDQNAHPDWATTSTLTEVQQQLQTAIDNIPTPDLSPYAGITQTDMITGVIEYPQNKTYRLPNLPYVMQIDSVTTRSSTGTCTFTVRINSTPLGGSANSVSTTEQTQTHSSNNVTAVGDDIEIVVSANASCEDLSFTIKYLRQLEGP